MAQVTGGSDFDFFWEQKAAGAWRLLREASDAWASGGEQATDVGIVIDRFMKVLARPGGWPSWVQLYWPNRFLLDVPPPSAIDSCVALSPRCGVENASAAVQALRSIVSYASQEWILGHPEEPRTRDVLNEMLAVLWNHKIAPHPPSAAYPREL